MKIKMTMFVQDVMVTDVQLVKKIPKEVLITQSRINET